MKHYTSLGDLPGTLPVFPLVGAILLPRTTLPLNVFEPRYLQMIDDCLRGDRLVGIIQPVGEGGRTGSPESNDASLKAVGCAGRLRSFQELDDGRLLIGLGGIVRFRPRDEVTDDRSYRTFHADYTGFERDLNAGDGAESVDRPRLVDALRRFLAQRGLKADWSSIEKSETEQLVNGLSMASPFSPEERQALLEAPTLAARADMLVTLAEMEIASGETGGGRPVQ